MDGIKNNQGNTFKNKSYLDDFLNLFSSNNSPVSTPVVNNNATQPIMQSSVPVKNIPAIKPTPTPEPTTEDDSDSRFLMSLIGQGIASLGAGIRGGDVGQVASQFNAMRDTQARQDERRKLQEEQKKQMAEITNPNSQSSIAKRKLYSQVMGINIPENISASDLSDTVVLQGLREQAKPKLVGGVGGGGAGVAKPKEEKEIKSNQKYISEYRDHVASLSEMGDIFNNIKLLNRTRIGSITPDLSVDTQAYSSSLDRAAQPMIKTLAGPGTLQKEERDTYGKLVPTGNTRSDLALRQANDIVIEGTKKSLAKMVTDLKTGELSKKDYNELINEYNEKLTNKNIGVGQVINPETGRLEPRQRIQNTLKDGRVVTTDQFGYIWE